MSRKIRVDASTPYDVIVEKGLLSQTGVFLSKLNASYKRCAVLTDSNVAPLYASSVVESIRKAGFEMVQYVLPAGEQSKSMSEALRIISWLSKNSFTRSDVLLALGGGVVGDLVGFVASIYLRGCDFIQLPTTLLAVIDSSVGGKTAINIPEGKNLVGTFWQPKLVLCDTATFATLTEEVFADGISEMIKYACIWDKSLFSALSNPNLEENSLEELAARCIKIKAEIVAQDERDNGLRQILNFGHTFGHAVEKLSRLTISHGQGVAIGMCIVTRSLEKQGKLHKGVARALEELLVSYHLPTRTHFSALEIANASLTDKKRSGDVINVIGIASIGEFKFIPLAVGEIEQFIEGGL